MYNFILLFLTCVIASATSQYACKCPPFYDLPMRGDQSDFRDQQTTRIPGTSDAEPLRVTSYSIPPRVVSRIAEDMNGMQQKQMTELYCLEVLDKMVTTRWQQDIDKISVSDLGNFSTLIKIPEFSNYYSNPESEWIQDEGMHLRKLDKCVRNLVGKAAPIMDPKEVECLNRIYPDYLSMESRTATAMEKLIEATSRDQLPFKSFYTYFEMTELLFDNKNIDALDDEIRAVHEDMLDFYIKTEEDKNKKFFIVEQECEWKNARLLREVSNEDARYQRFGQLIKSLVNRYLVAEILQKWVPGAIIPEYKYDLWSRARQTMENEISKEIQEAQRQKRDAQFLCTHAAELANKFYLDQKQILFDKMKDASLSSELKTHDKYSYVVALASQLAGKRDSRLPHVQVLVKEFKDGFYCLTNFIRMVENHQRYMIASAFTNEVLPYGQTYCLVKEMSAGLVNPRYCKCRGTFCEEFGLATIRSQRFQLNLLPDNTYSVTTNSSYRPLPFDPLVESANERIAGQKFNTWWYRHQKTPA